MAPNEVIRHERADIRRVFTALIGQNYLNIARKTDFEPCVGLSRVKSFLCNSMKDFKEHPCFCHLDGIACS